MLWITWWPPILGFTLSGFVQNLLPRDGLCRTIRSATDHGAPRRRHHNGPGLIDERLYSHQSVREDRVAYYFSSEGGRATFLSGSSPATPGTYELGRQSIHE